jgi:hypothetical protein
VEIKILINSGKKITTLAISGSLINNPRLRKRGVNIKVKKISSIMNSFNHKEIDLLKMDIEGLEYKIIDQIIKEKIPVKQLVVEFHDRFFTKGFGLRKKSILQLKKSGYYIFGISKSLEEFSFLKIN